MHLSQVPRTGRRLSLSKVKVQVCCPAEARLTNMLTTLKLTDNTELPVRPEKVHKIERLGKHEGRRRFMVHVEPHCMDDRCTLPSERLGFQWQVDPTNIAPFL